MESSSSPPPAWRAESPAPSLPESHGSVAVPRRGFWRKMFAFAGPGYLVAVGYMDPGNWATGIAAGSAFGYSLLSVILLSNVMAMILQTLCARLGIATGRDLAQACRDHYHPAVSFSLWVLCEIAICACDLAEVIGSAIALNLLFHLPILWGVIVTSLDVLAILYLQQRGFRYLEAVVVSVIGVVAACFGLEILFSHPSWTGVVGGFLPHAELIHNPDQLYLAIGILGATVMPHNLYLHSSLVQTRSYVRDAAGKREAIGYATIDSNAALLFALFVNAAILITAAAAFHTHGRHDVAELGDAYSLLSPMLGVSAAGVVFAIGLLASGQNSTLTGTLAGQIVMEGFLKLRIKPWLRRLVTRSIAIVPAAIVTALYGESGMSKLLIFSQVVLSLQLSFAVIPLVLFTCDKRKMGEFASPWWLAAAAWATTAVIVALNAKYIFDFATGKAS